MVNDGKKLYLQEKYDEALKYLREDDPFESLLIESIRITPKDESTNKHVCFPQLTLVRISIIKSSTSGQKGRKKYLKYLKFLKESSNKFIRILVEILEKILEFNKIDLNLFNSLNEREKAVTLYYIGLIYYVDKNNYKKAKDYIEDGIRSCEKVGEYYHKALMLQCLGSIYASMGYLDKSYEVYQESLEICERLNDWYGVANAKIAIARLYHRRLDAETCLELGKQALDICTQKEYRGILFAKAKAVIGLAYSLIRNYDKALKYLEDALEISSKEKYSLNFAFFTICKALIYRDIGKYNEALRLLEEAEKICKIIKRKHLKEGACTHRAIVLLEMGDVKSARRLLLRALKVAKDMKDFADVVMNLLYLVKATGKKKYIDEAIFYYKKWRMSLSFVTAKDVLSSYDPRVLVDSLLGRGDDSKAYDVHLELKNRSAIDIFGAKVVSEDLIGAEGVRKIRKAEKIVRSAERSSELIRSISEAREIVSEVLKPIVVDTYLEAEGDERVVDFHFGEKTGYFYGNEFKEIEFRDLRGFVENLLRDEDVKSALLRLYGIEGKHVKISEDWMYIIYDHDEDRYWWAKLIKRDDLLRLLNDILLACLTHPSHLAYKGIDEHGEILGLSKRKEMKKLSNYYQEIAESILKYLGEVFEDLFSYEEVVIAPAYPLVNLPYHLIMDNDGKMLIDVAGVKYVPHSGVAKRLKEKGEMKEVGIGKAVVVYSKDAPEADKEAEEIVKIIPDSEVIDATSISKEELLKRIGSDAKILHFACHAVAMPKAQYSYLKFPKFSLYLSDLLSLRLDNLNMVCLSACETGRYEEAIDTLGLPLAFFAKGAKNVVATQWVVYGKVAKEFFARFYDCIANGSDVYEAYRKTVLGMKRREKVMYYWGSFVYYGV